MKGRTYRMPAEWAPHAATWLSWPHNRETWPEGLQAAEAALVEAAVALAEGEPVYVNVLGPEHALHVMGLFEDRVAPERIVVAPIPTNDAWVRDHGAIIVEDAEGAQAALDFQFNAWGRKYERYDLDDAVACRMAEVLQLPCVSVGVVLEGGAIDVNGAGALLTTEQCLLHPNRNPRLPRSEIEAVLGRYLGARQVMWLGEGIAGDDTDGHVDDIARFVAEDTVVCALEADPADVNYAPLRENFERLKRARLADGRPLRVIELPMPSPVYRDARAKRDRLPASYANFYIGNAVVLLPVFDVAQDGAALEVLARLFPTRRIVAIDARALVVGLGAVHCLTQQVPSRS